jgi:hypothetical protein
VQRRTGQCRCPRKHPAMEQCLPLLSLQPAALGRSYNAGAQHSTARHGTAQRAGLHPQSMSRHLLGEDDCVQPVCRRGRSGRHRCLSGPRCGWMPHLAWMTCSICGFSCLGFRVRIICYALGFVAFPALIFVCVLYATRLFFCCVCLCRHTRVHSLILSCACACVCGIRVLQHGRVCMRTRVLQHTHTYKYVLVCGCVHARVSLHVCLLVSAFVRACMRVCACTHACFCLHAPRCMHARVCMHAICARVCAFTPAARARVHAHACMHVYACTRQHITHTSHTHIYIRVGVRVRGCAGVYRAHNVCVHVLPCLHAFMLPCFHVLFLARFLSLPLFYCFPPFMLSFMFSFMLSFFRALPIDFFMIFCACASFH